MAGQDMMQTVRRSLEKWLPRMERATYSKLTIISSETGFIVQAVWSETKAGPAGTHSMLFTKERVLGGTASLPPLNQRPVKKVCRFMDDVVREVLEVRKVR